MRHSRLTKVSCMEVSSILGCPYGGIPPYSAESSGLRLVGNNTILGVEVYERRKQKLQPTYRGWGGL